MFVDKVSVELKAGDGGNGAMSFRHEKFIDRGGPDGGDGGKGGDIIVVASNSQNTLAKFRFQKEIVANSGKAGSKRRKAGRSGSDLEVALPVGTIVTDEKDKVLADLTHEGQKILVARGGRGGFGNAHFKSSVRQAPRFAEKGDPGDQMLVTLELKMIAYVGLVGLPNAGKSTLIASVSNARPEIANYPFTTLIPNLGVVDIYESSVLFADIPGLIRGASLGKGLGDEFLRHVERTKVLIHLVDANSEDIETDYNTVRDELSAYRVDLSKKPFIVALNKIDSLSKEEVAKKLKVMKKLVGKQAKVIQISALSKLNLKELLDEVQVQITALAKESVPEDEPEDNGVFRITLDESEKPWNIEKSGKNFLITGKKIEGFARRTDFENEEAIGRLKNIMRKIGIMHELSRMNAPAGCKIFFGEKKDKYIEY